MARTGVGKCGSNSSEDSGAIITDSKVHYDAFKDLRGEEIIGGGGKTMDGTYRIFRRILRGEEEGLLSRDLPRSLPNLPLLSNLPVKDSKEIEKDLRSSHR